MQLGRTLGVYGLIYVGTIFYTLASYFHLKLSKWTFIAAYTIALSCVVLEYNFSLRGSHFANDVLKINPVQIFVADSVFCFINIMLLNIFVLKQPFKWWRELSSLALIIGAIIVSNL